jgi:hypothetical protein
LLTPADMAALKAVSEVPGHGDGLGPSYCGLRLAEGSECSMVSAKSPGLRRFEHQMI